MWEFLSKPKVTSARFNNLFSKYIKPHFFFCKITNLFERGDVVENVYQIQLSAKHYATCRKEKTKQNKKGTMPCLHVQSWSWKSRCICQHNSEHSKTEKVVWRSLEIQESFIGMVIFLLGLVDFVGFQSEQKYRMWGNGRNTITVLKKYSD